MSEPLDLDALEAALDAPFPTGITLDAIAWRGQAKLLIAEVRRLRQLTESMAMEILAAKTKIMALMGAMNLTQADLERRAKAEPDPGLEKL